MLPACASTFNMYNPARSRLYLPAFQADLLLSDTSYTMSGVLAVLLSVQKTFSLLVGRRIGLSVPKFLEINPMRTLASAQYLCSSSMHSLSLSVPLIYGLPFN